MMFFCIAGLIFYHVDLESTARINISDYSRYFPTIGVGIMFYVTGRLIYFLGAVVKELNLGLLDQNRMKNKLCDIGLEAFGILTTIVSIASVVSLVDNILRKRPFEFYKGIIILIIIIGFCQIAHCFLRKQITFKTELPD